MGNPRELKLRLFYSDPLKAAWMLREHGIRFIEGNARTMAECMPLDLRTCGLWDIEPDCYNLFEPRTNDWIKRKVHIKRATISKCRDEWECSLGEAETMIKCGGKIIMRDDREFFMPEGE